MVDLHLCITWCNGLRFLVIIGLDEKLDLKKLADITKEEVKHNQSSDEGISVFDCGVPIPELDWDTIVLVGNCVMESKPGMRPTSIIKPGEDALGEIVELVENSQISDTEEAQFES